MSEKKNIDARPFPEIWGMLNDLEQKGLTQSLVAAGISDDTILNWKKGRTKTRPRKIYVDTTVRILRAHGYYVLPETLFPIK